MISPGPLVAATMQVTPALGAAGGSGTGSKGFKRWIPYGILQTGTNMDSLVAACRGLVAQVRPRSATKGRGG